MAQNQIYSQHLFINELQKVKRESYSRFIDNLVEYSVYGFAIGLGAGIIFRRKVLFAGIGSGLGGGIAFNKCADRFNRIENIEEIIVD